jgi:hypothetical protein
VLADTGDDPRPLTKAGLAQALDGFCSTTAPQDRVVLYFGVHALEKDGKAFVVPLDGDPDAPGSLLPVADVYAKLNELTAAQKVVIWDVCRFNPDRVRGRRDPGPMTDALFKALTAPPPGVQALVSCSPGERGLEYSAPRGPAALFAGSAYLDALRLAAESDLAKLGAGDPIPVGAWNNSALGSVAAVARAVGVKQTPVAVGGLPKGPAAFDPKAAPAKRFDMPAPPKVVPEAKSVFDELALPPLFDEDTAQPARLPFAAEALTGYAPEVSAEEALKSAEKYPLRVATLRALQAVRNVWPRGGPEARRVTPLAAPVTEKAKAGVGRAQEGIAVAVAELELALGALEAVAGKRAKEPKRWQAHYDYALAEVRLRLVLLNEYNLVLARVRTETLPDLAAGAPGWRLVPSDKLTARRDVKEMLDASWDGFAKVAADHPGTPWEVLARRSRATVPGLRWEPLPAEKR